MKKIFAANWKLQKTPEGAKLFCEALSDKVLQLQDLNSFEKSKEIFIFPQNFSLETVIKSTQKISVNVGPQQIYTEKNGAFTGENSAELAKAMGAKTVLLGHSERRQFFNETADALVKKINLCQALDLIPVYCIGETLAERQAGQTEKVCLQQITDVLQSTDKSKRLIVAYEPVWAIGTGQVATSAQVKDVHQFLFEELTKLKFTNFAILYGGSVKPENASELIQLPHVDGFLIGGASLDIESFWKICLV